MENLKFDIKNNVKIRDVEEFVIVDMETTREEFSGDDVEYQHSQAISTGEMLQYAYDSAVSDYYPPAHLFALVDGVYCRIKYSLEVM